MLDNDLIATVNYADFISGIPEKRKAFIENLGKSFSNMGFAIVENHGVGAPLREKLYQASRRFFALPDPLKQHYEDLQLNGQRGYVSKNRESAKGKNTPDMKEFFHIGQEVLDGDPIKDQYPDNIWVDELPELQIAGMEVYRTFEQTGQNLLKAIALYLGLEEDYFTPRIHNGNSILRLLHYYPILDVSQIAEGAERAAAHGDINLITLLMGVNADGLQAQSLQGEWIDVRPKENQIVVNIGDMLSRHSNGKLRSTIHRVINPPLDKLGTSRYSTPFFLHPRMDMDLSCLPQCINDENPKQFEDITAGAFLEERLRELGLMKPKTS